jgi:hypothetical protein
MTLSGIFKNGREILPVQDTMDLGAQSSAPSGVTNTVRLYTLDGLDLLMVDETGESHVVHGFNNFKSYAFSSPLGTTGAFYAAGYYEAPAADTTITQASATQTLGGANLAHGAHAFIVASGPGSASGGAGTVEIEVSGTSITDAGARITSDTEVLTTDITTMSTDDYLETSKKWLGQVTYTIQPSGAGTHTTYSATFNYGLCKYEDWGNRDFEVTDFEMVGLAGANDSSFDIELLHHKATGWTYDAAAFVAGNGAVVKMSDDYSTESNLSTNDQFAYKRAGLSTDVTGSGSEGVVVRITTGSNGAVRNSSIHIGVEF